MTWQEFAKTFVGIVIVAGVLASVGWVVAVGTRREAADGLRYWQAQSRLVVECRASGGFAVQHYETNRQGTGLVFVSCAFPPKKECP